MYRRMVETVSKNLTEKIGVKSVKSVSVMCVDHASSYGELYSQLATYGIETRPVNVNNEDFLEELGREPHALFIAPDAFAELEIIRSEYLAGCRFFALLNKIKPTLIGILFDEKIRLRTWQEVYVTSYWAPRSDAEELAYRWTSRSK